MGRIFLILGQLMTVFGCLVSVIRFIGSIGEMVDKWNVVTGDLIFAPFGWVYAFIINVALFFVFARVNELESKFKHTESH
jgi:hypothetical protein